MTGQKPMPIREVAHRGGRAVKAVHSAVTALINAGILDRTAVNVAFP
jgi:predicted transcriptional regulator